MQLVDKLQNCWHVYIFWLFSVDFVNLKQLPIKAKRIQATTEAPTTLANFVKP